MFRNDMFGDDTPGDDPIARYLQRCRELNAFCQQDGWIDDGTIEYRVQERRAGEAVIAVTFVEIIMEGAGCVAGRLDRFGLMRLALDERGEVRSGTPL